MEYPSSGAELVPDEILSRRSAGWSLDGHPERLPAWLALHAAGLWTPSRGWRAILAHPNPEAAVRSMRAGRDGRDGPGMPWAARLAEAGAHAITFFDGGYPEALKDLRHLHHTAGPPPLLFVLGRLPRMPAVALVGARRADAYGLRLSRKLARELAARGIAIVSGLARGIDAAAHCGALDVGGVTVAVLGGGLAHVYPPEHAGLAGEIAGEGAVVSEFPFDFAPRPRTFPLRNRVIAALADVVVVVQAGERSGSLVTARHAQDLNRAVGVVPGDVDRASSAGSNGLLQDGAQVVTCPEDVLALFSGPGRAAAAIDGESGPATSWFGRPAGPPVGDALDADAAAVWRLLDSRSASVDEIVSGTGLSVPAVLAALTDLELSGLAERSGAGYARAPGHFRQVL